MSDYSRFISYLHFYKKGIKGAGAGHARIEIKQEVCKTSIRVKCNDVKDGVLDAFYYIRGQRNGDKLQTMKVGTITITEGVADACFETSKYNLFNKGVSFDKIQGILFCVEPGIDYLAADWEEKTLYPDDVISIYADRIEVQKEPVDDIKVTTDKKYYERIDPADIKTEWISSDSIETIPFEAIPLEAIQMNIVNDRTTNTFEPPQFIDTNVAEHDLSLNIPKEETKTTSVEPKAMEEADALNVFFEKKATEQIETANSDPEILKQADDLNVFFEKKATEQMETANSVVRPKTLEQVREFTNSDVKPKILEQAMEATNSNVRPKEQTLDAKISVNKPKTLEQADAQHVILVKKSEQTEAINPIEQKTPQMVKNQEVEEPPKDTTIKVSQVHTQDLKGEANLPPNCHGRRMPWEDTPEARDILNNNLKMYPFQDGEIAECVKIEPKDIGKLPVEFWVLGNNSFLLHSYCNYKYLMFAKRINRLKREYLLMIPGIYQQREKLMAKMFGFDYFKCANCREQRPGEFGYWYMIINF